jgi:acyl transferase domain-containing protein
MAHEMIPRHLHLKKLNPDVEVSLDTIPAVLPLTAVPWKRRKLGGKPRIAGINSFGITGAQAHVLVQEPPLQETLPWSKLPLKSEDYDVRPLTLMTFSAKTEEAFRAQVAAYKYGVLYFFYFFNS